MLSNLLKSILIFFNICIVSIEFAHGAADLYISSVPITVTPSTTMVPGDTAILSAYTIHNGGDVATGYFSNGFYLSTDSTLTTSDIYLDGNGNSNLDPFSDYPWGEPDLIIPDNTVLGDYYIGILLDRDNQVPESDETNNFMSVKITIVASSAVEEFGCHALPLDYTLSQNYPNPFNPSTTIEFDISSYGFVSLKVYNVMGQEVATLINKELPSGNHKVEWKPENLSSGIYYYKLETKGYQETKKLVLMK
jgi:hypothetical protein